MILGWPLAKRRAHIKKITEEKTGKTWPVPFQGRNQHYDIYSVSADLPKYRLENGRTTDKQAAYLAKHQDLPSDFFRRDFELESAQQAQHEILKSLAGDKHLLRTFKKVKQDEPLILSSDGFVVNGNRRLCAMRMLVEEDPAAFKRFMNIEVVVLPPCDDRDMDDTEAELQLKEDLKSDYKWTAFACMLREKKKKYNLNEKELGAIYGRKPKEIKELLIILSEAEIFLDDQGKPYDYDEVLKDEFAFRQLFKARKIIQSEPKKEIFDRSSYLLISDNISGERVYSVIPKIAKHIDAIIESVCDELNLPFSDPNDDNSLMDIADAMSNDAVQDIARVTVRDRIDVEERKVKERKRIDFVLHQVESAALALSDAYASIDKKTSKEGIENNLSKINELTQKIRDWVNG